MSNVAVITARGGSKRIPRKNIKPFNGKPIIAYSIETAIKSGLFDLVMVSTDDEDIAKIAVQYGAEVPFFRSAGNSNDHAGTADVLLEVIEKLKELGREFDNVCGIYPTAPFLSATALADGLELLKKENYAAVLPVTKFSYPISRAFQMKARGKIEMIWPENLNKRSQDLAEAYHDAGQFYWLNTQLFLLEKKIFTANCGSIVLNELQVQDIDSETDWELAEFKYSFLTRHGQKGS